MLDPTLNEEEKAIVRLVAEGLTRWAIADRLGRSENSVRLIIRNLCAHFNCSMRELPDAVGLEDEEPEDDEDGAFL